MNTQTEAPRQDRVEVTSDNAQRHRTCVTRSVYFGQASVDSAKTSATLRAGDELRLRRTARCSEDPSASHQQMTRVVRVAIHAEGRAESKTITLMRNRPAWKSSDCSVESSAASQDIWGLMEINSCVHYRESCKVTQRGSTSCWRMTQAHTNNRAVTQRQQTDFPVGLNSSVTRLHSRKPTASVASNRETCMKQVGWFSRV